jgi:carbonic anhydrase/acetyltransferase-like protein (isoleucine patch superfamily)
MGKKYELIETDYDGYSRVKALKDFQLITGEMVKKEDLGGLVNGEHNLSHEGNCWISYYAKAIGDSKVIDNAVLKDYSMARDSSTVSGNAVMKDYSVARDSSTVSGNAVMKGNSETCDSSTVSGDTVMNDYSRICDSSTVSGNAVMKDWSNVFGTSIITGNALLQAHQNIKYGTVTTDLLGTKDWIGTLYAEFGLVPKDNKVVLYKKVWSTDDPDVFKSDYDRNLLYKIGKISRVRKVDEDVFKSCTRGLHFTSLEFVNRHKGNTILECEVEVPDIVTVQGSKVRARKCKVLRVYKE